MANSPTPTPDAAQYRYQLINLGTGQAIQQTEWRCWDPPVVPGQPPPEPPPPPPLPPSPQEVYDRAGIPLPLVNISPEVRGLVGLDTWLWYDQATEVSVAVDLAGWHAEVTVHIVSWEYDLGNGDGVSGERQPTEANPYVTYFSRKCNCEVTAITVWDGTYTATHPALLGPITVPLGERAFVGPPLPYEVIEIEAVIGPPGPGDD
jgi:hypothetical protein